MTIADEIGRQYGADVSYSLKIEGVGYEFTDGKRPGATTLPIGSTCVGAWLFDEASGDCLDATGNGHTGTENGTIAAQTGKFTGARGPFTTAKYFEVADDPALRLQTYTVIGWIYVESTSQYRFAKCAVKEYNHDDNSWQLQTVNGNGTNNLQANNSIFQFGALATDGTDGTVSDTVVRQVGWHQVAASVDGSQTVRFWINGELIGTNTDLAGKTLRYDAQGLFFGRDRDYTYQHFRGYLDDWRLYTGAKSDEWVQLQYNGLPALIPPSSELSTGLDLKTMKVDASSLEIQLANVRDPSDTSLPRKYYFAKLFAPGRTSATGVNTTLVRRLDADDIQIDADATTIYVQSKEAFDTSGTIYIGNETIDYTGVSTELQTNFENNQTIGKFTGCTRGMYPALTSTNRGRTYAYPITGDDLPGDVGDFDQVSSEPYTMIGREVGLWQTARDPDTGDWFDTPTLAWAGKIAEDISYDPKTDTWNLTAENILVELEAMIPRRTPSAFVHQINLNGDLGRAWRITERDTNGDILARGEFEIAAGYYTIAGLQQAITDEIKLTANWTEEPAKTHPHDYGMHWFTSNDGQVSLLVEGFGSTPGIEWTLVPSPMTKKYQPCHAWQALGFRVEDPFKIVMGVWGSVTQEQNTIVGGERAYSHYHPTNPDYNGSVMHCKFPGSDKLWEDQGDWGTTLAWLRVDDQPVAGVDREEGEYIQAYSAWAIDTDDLYELTLENPAGVPAPIDADPGLDASMFGFIGSQDRFSGVEIKNMIRGCQMPLDTQVRRGPLEMLLFPMLSSGTAGYNDATYDAYPFDASAHFPAELVDKDSFTAADSTLMAAHSDLADRGYYPLFEGDPLSDLVARESILWGLCLAWDPTKGQIAIKQIAAPRMHLAETTLTAATRANPRDYPRISSNSGNVINVWKVEASYRNGKPKFKGTFRDPVSIKAIGERETKIDHPGLRAGPQQIKGMLDTLFRNRSMINRYPHQRLTVTLAPKLAADLSIGDTITYQADTAHPDPLGSGEMSCDTEGIVIDLRWSLKTPGVGVAEIMLIDHTVYPWGVAAMVDQSAANGGWDDANDRLTLLPLQFGEAGDVDDGAAFGDTHEVLILESAPEDPSAPDVWGPFAVNGDYEDDGANILSLPAATTLAGWDSTKEHVVICAEYSDATTAQRLLNTFQADAVTHLLDASDSAQRYG